MRAAAIGRWAAWLLLAALLACAAGPARAQPYSIRLGDDVVLHPYGLYQLDEAGFAESKPGGQAAGANARRLRTGARIAIADQVEAGVIWESGSTPGGQARLFEAQVTYVGLKPFAFTVGVFKPSFGLESVEEAGDTLFLERSDISTITRDIAAGIEREAVQAKAFGDRYHVAVALTAGMAGPGRDGDQRAVVARAVGLPWRTEAGLLHLGVNGEYVFRPARDAGALPAYTYSAFQELRIDDIAAPLSTKAIPLRSQAAVGPEVGLTAGRFWAQAEWYSILADRRLGAGGGTEVFSGWYAQASYTLTGKPRQWTPATATWGAPEPDGAFDPSHGRLGSFELGGRFSTVNLSSTDINGGRERIWSAVLNWRPVKLLRFALEYEHATVDGGPDPRRFNAVAARAQVHF